MTRTQWQALVRKEYVLFIQYALIASLAASLAHDLLWTADRWEISPPALIEGPPDDINLMGMIKVWVDRFWIPWFTAFLPAALVSFLLRLTSYWYLTRMVTDAGGNAETPARQEPRLHREGWVFAQYFLVSFGAVTYVLNHYVQDRLRWNFNPLPMWLSGQLEMIEVLKVLADRFYGPWLLSFAVLSIARFLGLLLVRRFAASRAASSAS
jgi:hypothetical protein